jgi:uridine phosphorylase
MTLRRVASYPNYAGKHAEDPFFTVGEYAAYARRMGRWPEYDPPEGVIISYQRSLYDRVLSLEGIERPHDRPLLHGMVPLPSTDGRVGIVGRFGIGAPVAATVLEELIGFGVHRFASIGTAGSLQKACGIGSLVVCERSIRDEGVSHHYIEPGTYSFADVALTEALASLLPDATRGTSWTIDTPFRETIAEARHYQAEGVLCVEMEAAALFAVAAARGVPICSAFTISDSLADLVWDPQFHSTETESGLLRLYEAALALL